VYILKQLLLSVLKSLISSGKSAAFSPSGIRAFRLQDDELESLWPYRFGLSVDSQASTDESRVAQTDAVVNLLNVVDIARAVDADMRLQSQAYDGHNSLTTTSVAASPRLVVRLFLWQDPCLATRIDRAYRNYIAWSSRQSDCLCGSLSTDPGRSHWLHYRLGAISSPCVAHSSAFAAICRRLLLVYALMSRWLNALLSFYNIIGNILNCK